MRNKKKRASFFAVMLVIIMAINGMTVMAAGERDVTCCEKCGSKQIQGTGVPKSIVWSRPCKHEHDGYEDTYYTYTTNVRYTCGDCGHAWTVLVSSGYLICGYDGEREVIG